MEARFYGHAAVMLTGEEGTSLLIDPYNPGGFDGAIAYPPIEDEPDAVVCSHDHLDHCAVDDLVNDPVRLEGDARFGPFEVRRHSAYHDEYGGRRRGGAVDILEIRVDGLCLVHLSDVGHSPSPDLVESLAGCDVVFLPVGGYYTIGAAQGFEWWRRLAPRRVVPVHYGTDRCGLPIRPRRIFDTYAPRATPERDSRVELGSPMISFESSVVLLNPQS